MNWKRKIVILLSEIFWTSLAKIILLNDIWCIQKCHIWLFILAMCFSECVQNVLNMAHSTKKHSEVSMSNIFRLPKVNPLSACPTTPHPQPTPLASCSAAAAVSQVDLLCATPLKNYMTPCQKKINWKIRKWPITLVRAPTHWNTCKCFF